MSQMSVLTDWQLLAKPCGAQYCSWPERHRQDWWRVRGVPICHQPPGRSSHCSALHWAEPVYIYVGVHLCVYSTQYVCHLFHMHFMFCRSCGLFSHLNAVIGSNQLHLLKYYKTADILLIITMWQCERGLVLVINLNRKLKMIFWGKVLPLFDIPIK